MNSVGHRIPVGLPLDRSQFHSSDCSHDWDGMGKKSMGGRRFNNNDLGQVLHKECSSKISKCYYSKCFILNMMLVILPIPFVPQHSET